MMIDASPSSPGGGQLGSIYPLGGGWDISSLLRKRIWSSSSSLNFVVSECLAIRLMQQFHHPALEIFEIVQEQSETCRSGGILTGNIISTTFQALGETCLSQDKRSDVVVVFAIPGASQDECGYATWRSLVKTR